MKETTIISLGGSMIVPEEIDTEYLKKFKDMIINHIKMNEKSTVIIVCGGGKTCRKYQNATKVTNINSNTEDLDWVGIMSTKLNAEMVRVMFKDFAYKKVIDNPEDEIVTDKQIIIGAGYLPGSSSDKDAILLAKNFKADKIINLTNIEYVYDKDPKIYKDAKRLENISWDEFTKIFDMEWKAGMNAPFDPVAARLAKKENISVNIIKGNDFDSIKSAIKRDSFVGTIIK